MANSIIELYTQVPADLEGNVFGQFDEHLKLIERTTECHTDLKRRIVKDSRDRAECHSGKETDRRTGGACRKGQHHYETECKLRIVTCDGRAQSGAYRDR